MGLSLGPAPQGRKKNDARPLSSVQSSATLAALRSILAQRQSKGEEDFLAAMSEFFSRLDIAKATVELSKVGLTINDVIKSENSNHVYGWTSTIRNVLSGRIRHLNNRYSNSFYLFMAMEKRPELTSAILSAEITKERGWSGSFELRCSMIGRSTPPMQSFIPGFTLCIARSTSILGKQRSCAVYPSARVRISIPLPESRTH